MSFAEICGEPSPQALAAAQPLTAKALKAAAPAVTTVVTSTAAATGTVVKIFTPFGNVEPDNKAAAGGANAGGTGLDLIWIVLAGVIVIPAAALLVLGLLRRRK